MVEFLIYYCCKLQIFFKRIPFIFSKKITKNLLQFLGGCNQAGCTEMAQMQCTKFDENALNCNSGSRLFKMNLYDMIDAYRTCAIGSLTCLTWLTHTLFLPSKWNLYPKIPFWPKNDSEKWSRIIYFEIRPCRKIASALLWSKRK